MSARKRRTRSAAVPQVEKAYDVTESDGHHELVATRAEVYAHMSAGAVWAREVDGMNWFAAGVEAELAERRLTVGGAR